MKTNLIEKRNEFLKEAAQRLEAAKEINNRSEFIKNLLAEKKAVGEKIRQENLSRGN